VSARSKPLPPVGGPAARSRFLEALLFIGQPVWTPTALSQAWPAVSASTFEAVVARLTRRYRRQNRPFAVVQCDSGLVLELLPDVRRDLARRWRCERSIPLPREAMEVLALIAYRQPISRTDIEAVLSIDSRSTLRLLARQQLIRTQPAASGDAATSCYVTTPTFLESFGLQKLDDLPTSIDFL
jgi:segregation and condensation protein B